VQHGDVALGIVATVDFQLAGVVVGEAAGSANWVVVHWAHGIALFRWLELFDLGGHNFVVTRSHMQHFDVALGVVATVDFKLAKVVVGVAAGSANWVVVGWANGIAHFRRLEICQRFN